MKQTAFYLLLFFCGITGNAQITSSSFQPRLDLSIGTGSLPDQLAAVDLDGDGKKDIIVNSNVGTGAFSIFRNISTPGSLTSFSFATRLDSPTIVIPDAVCAGDIDVDGKIDFGSGSWSNYMIFFRNTSTLGSISLAAPYNVYSTST